MATSGVEHENGVKYAVSYCLSKAYKGSEFSRDAKLMSGSYIQNGSYGIDVYESIREFVDTYTKQKYMSKHGNNLDIMQCIDLSGSSELNSVIAKMTGVAHK
jgi:Type VI secretion system (T6SS), amidase immunity protein